MSDSIDLPSPPELPEELRHLSWPDLMRQGFHRERVHGRDIVSRQGMRYRAPVETSTQAEDAPFFDKELRNVSPMELMKRGWRRIERTSGMEVWAKDGEKRRRYPLRPKPQNRAPVPNQFIAY